MFGVIIGIAKKAGMSGRVGLKRSLFNQIAVPNTIGRVPFLASSKILQTKIPGQLKRAMRFTVSLRRLSRIAFFGISEQQHDSNRTEL